MKRLLIIFLFLLPLQASWAAMGAYAHHGEGEENHHSALHKHKHADKHPSDTSSEKLRHHCSFSHVGGVALTGFFQLAFYSPAGSFVSPNCLVPLRAPVPQRPERPN